LSRRVRLFNYSPAEWEAIAAAVQRVRANGLSGIETHALRLQAQEYLVEQKRRNEGQDVKPSELRSSWKKVSRLSDDLKTAVSDAASTEMRAGLQQTRMVVVDFKQALFLDAVQSILFLSIDEICAFLSDLERTAKSNEWRFGTGPHRAWSVSGRRDPGVIFQQQILWLWTHRFGGKLAFSKGDSKRPHGPLVDYLRAVTGPVMKERAPKPSGLRDIINRQKDFYTWLDGQEEDLGKFTPFAILQARRKRVGKSNQPA
jgi:hypothetical protein